MPSGKKKRAQLREDPDGAEKRDKGAGLTSWARSLGAAAGFVRRLVTRDEPVGGDGRPLGRSAPGDSALRDSALRDSGLRGAAPPSKRERFKANAAFLSHQRRVKAEVRDLEAQLDRLHASITTGVVPPDAESGATTSALDTWILRSRELREHLQDKRAELSRLQRTMAREDRLYSKDAPRTRRMPEDEGRASPPTSAEKFSPTVSGERRKALVKALRTLIQALNQHSARRAVKRTARSLLDADADVRREAVTLLGGMDNPAVFDVLLVTVEDPSERVRLATLNALAGLQRAAAATVFRRFLGAESAPLRLAALRGLASLDTSRLHSSELVAGIEDEDAGVRKAAAAILGWQQTEGVVPQRVLTSLTFALTDGAESVRLATVEALGAVGGQRAVFSLMRTLADSSEEVRAAGLRALRGIVGDDVDAIGVDLPAEERVEALRHWWKGARVRGVTPSTFDASTLDASAESAPLEVPVARPQPARRPAPVADVQPEPLDAELPNPEQTEEASIFESDEEGGGDFENVMFEDDGPSDIAAKEASPDIAAKEASPDIAAKEASPDIAAKEVPADVSTKEEIVEASKEKAEEKPEAVPKEAAVSSDAKAEQASKEAASAEDASAKTEGDKSPAAEANGDANGDANANGHANGDANGNANDAAIGDDEELSIPGPSDLMDFGLDAEEQEGGEQFESLFGDSEEGEGGEEGADDASGEGGFESIMGDVADSGE